MLKILTLLLLVVLITNLQNKLNRNCRGSFLERKRNGLKHFNVESFLIDNPDEDDDKSFKLPPSRIYVDYTDTSLDVSLSGP
jgi:hypothetical protein